MDAKPRKPMERDPRRTGERTPPASISPIKAEPEKKKPAGVGGAPSPVGENDLA